MNVWTKLHDNPLNSCQDILLKKNTNINLMVAASVANKNWIHGEL